MLFSIRFICSSQDGWKKRKKKKNSQGEHETLLKDDRIRRRVFGYKNQFYLRFFFFFWQTWISKVKTFLFPLKTNFKVKKKKFPLRLSGKTAEIFFFNRLRTEKIHANLIPTETIFFFFLTFGKRKKKIKKAEKAKTEHLKKSKKKKKNLHELGKLLG